MKDNGGDEWNGVYVCPNCMKCRVVMNGWWLTTER